MNAIFNHLKDATAMNATPIPAPVALSPLAAKAMLVSLSIKQWDGRKLDRRASDKVTSDANASATAARVTKSLVAKAALAEIAGIATRARAEFYKRSLPWANDGTRLLSNLAFLEFGKVMRELQAEFNAAADKLEAALPGAIRQAEIDLGALFDPADYPAPSEIRARFSFPRPRVFPLPNAADFRVDIGAEALADERARIEADMQSLLSDAMRDVTARIVETVGTMAEKLKAFKPAKGKGDKSEGIFRDSLVANVRELVDVLPALNLTGDARLTAIAERMRELVATDASVLREHGDVRRDIADKAAAIAAEVADYF
jgi:hypothetical protein